jgi:hypothetical protein
LSIGHAAERAQADQRHGRRKYPFHDSSKHTMDLLTASSLSQRLMPDHD